MSEEAVEAEAPVEEAATPEVEAAPEEASGPTENWRDKVDALLEESQQRRQQVEAKAAAEAEPEDEPEQPKLSWDQVMSKQDPEVQQIMKQLRGESTRRFQEAADLKRQVEAERTALFDSPLFKRLQEVAGSEAEIDPFNPKSFEAYIEKKVAERLQNVLRPVQQAHQQSMAQQSYKTFMEGHPDLRTDTGLREEVATLLRADDAMTLENAYHIIKGRKAIEHERSTQARRKRERMAARTAALKVTASPARSAGTPSPDMVGKNAHEIYDLLLRAKQ